MNAINLNCCDAYGSMLWDLSEDYTESFLRSWNVQARHCWNIPRTTHVYLVENFFCSDIRSLRNQVYCRYANFVKKLKLSSSYEVKVLSEAFKSDASSTTYKNLQYLNERSNVNVLETEQVELRQLFPKESGPRNDSWRISLLKLFLNARSNFTYRTELNISEQYVKEMIDSLCSS